MKEKIAALIVIILIFIIVMFVNKTIFEVVISSDMPEWLKYMILR